MACRKNKQPVMASAAHTINKPLTIYTVDEYGTIHALDCDMPNTNADAFDLDISKADTISGLVELQSQSDFFEGIANQFDELDVVIVEGDRPGSTYFAAELRGEIEEANAVLARWGCDYRFAVE